MIWEYEVTTIHLKCKPYFFLYWMYRICKPMFHLEIINIITFTFTLQTLSQESLNCHKTYFALMISTHNVSTINSVTKINIIFYVYLYHYKYQVHADHISRLWYEVVHRSGDATARNQTDSSLGGYWQLLWPPLHAWDCCSHSRQQHRNNTNHTKE